MEMKMRKVVVLVALVITVGLVGCDGKGAESKNTEKSKTEAEEKVYEPPQPDEPPVMPGFVAAADDEPGKSDDLEVYESVDVELKLKEIHTSYGRVDRYTNFVDSDCGVADVTFLGQGGNGELYDDTLYMSAEALRGMKNTKGDTFKIESADLATEEHLSDLPRVILSVEEIVPEDIPAWGM